MNLLSGEKITKGYSEKNLLDEVSLFLKEGDRVGIVGVNGTGKSTLLKIMAGLEEADRGTVVRAGGIRVGYLPQIPHYSGDLTVLQQVFFGASAQTQEAKVFEAKSILTKLGISDFDQKTKFLSGGQKKRVAIAGALVNPCEVLILDEPTNHIDSDMVWWLEKYLSRFRGALLMVTHDRYFLDRVTNQIVELDRGRLYTYEGNYSSYLEQKEQRQERLAGSERKRQSILRAELEWIRRGVRARGTKSKFRIQRYEELRDRDTRTAAAALELSSVSSRLGRKIVELYGINKAYEGRTLIKDLSFLIQRNARLGIIGPNGCGKSTLLKIICGILLPDSGEVVIGETVKFGYFAQECEEMNPQKRVIDSIRDIAENIETTEGSLSASQILEKFLFPGDLQYTEVGRLSGGEKRRLFLLRVLMGAPNILLLDEPTNDLDIETLMILEDYLQGFQGAVLAVSHDRYFLDKVADHMLEFKEGGKIKQYLGGYSDYFAESSRALKLQKPKEEKAPDSKVRRPISPKKLKFSFKEQREFEEIDDIIAELEKALQSVKGQIEDQASDYTALEELLTKRKALETQLEEQTERWVYLNELAEKIENQKG